MPRARGERSREHNADGKARVTLEGDVAERIDLQLDASDASFAKVHTQSPTGSFEMPNIDGEIAYEVKFTRDKKAPKKFVKASGPK
jgi:hypothetical protein